MPVSHSTLWLQCQEQGAQRGSGEICTGKAAALNFLPWLQLL